MNINPFRRGSKLDLLAGWERKDRYDGGKKGYDGRKRD